MYLTSSSQSSLLSPAANINRRVKPTIIQTIQNKPTTTPSTPPSPPPSSLLCHWCYYCPCLPHSNLRRRLWWPGFTARENAGLGLTPEALPRGSWGSGADSHASADAQQVQSTLQRRLRGKTRVVFCCWEDLRSSGAF